MRRAHRVVRPFGLSALAVLAGAIVLPLARGVPPRPFARIAALAAAPSAPGGAVAEAAPPHPPPAADLTAEPAAGTLATGQAHRFRLELEAGDYAHVEVEQLGADVTVALIDPGGTPRLIIDTPTFTGADGVEHLHVHARAGGVHVLEVRAIDDRGPESGYRARLAARRPATAGDRGRVEAEERFQRAVGRRLAGDEAAAVEPLAGAVAGFTALGEPARAAEAEAELCTALTALERLAEAQASCRRALAYYQREGPAWRRALTLHTLGELHRAGGEPERAVELFLQALPLIEELDEPWTLAQVTGDLGLARQELRAFDQALADFGAALALWRRVGEPRRAAGVLHARGQAWIELGKPLEAAEDFRAALAIPEWRGGERAATLSGLGLALIEAADPLAAEPPLAEALAIQRAAGDRGGEALSLTTLGLARATRGRAAEARRFYRRALPLASAAGDRELVGHLRHNLAWLEVDDGRHERAIRLFRRALREYRLAGDRQAEVRTLLGLARAERARGRPEAALGHLETALVIVADLRERLERYDLRVSYMARRYDLYDFAVELLMEIHRRHPGQGWDARALEMSERARGRGLLDLLTELGIGERTAGGRRPEVLDAAAIRNRLLDRDTVLLEYKLGERRSYLWAVGRDGLESFELPGRAELERLATAVHRQIGRPPQRAAATTRDRALGELSRALLCPAERRLGRRRLIVVAEADLLYVPFAALSLSHCGPGGPSSGPAGPAVPLYVGREIVTTPSASNLAALRRRTRPAPPERTLAVVADPVFGPCDDRVPAHRRPPACPPAPPRLRHSGEEAAAILALVPAGRRFAAVGFDASRPEVLERLAGGAAYLHVASHVDTAEDPPRVLLTGFDRHGTPVAGAELFAHEIAALELPSDLVVLSGCGSGLGRAVRGEGLVGLTQSFMRAGAGGVLVSLWPVDDRATAILMTSFYRLLLEEGLPPAAALSRAQGEVARDPRWHSPYFWAGFVLVGEGVPPAAKQIAGLRNQ